MKKTLSFLLALALALGFSATTATAATPETVTNGSLSVSNVVFTESDETDTAYICYEPTITINEDICWVNFYYYYDGSWIDIYFDTSYSGTPFIDASNTPVTMTDTNTIYSMDDYLSACLAGSIDYFNAPTTIAAGASFDMSLAGAYVLEVLHLDGTFDAFALIILPEADAIAYADELAGASDASTDETLTEEVEETEEPADTTTEETQIVTGTATATNGLVLVNGEEVSFESYNIDGSNYFMLRDLAAAFTGTDKQFEVTYNTETKAIDLISGAAYTAVGGELTLGDGTAKTYKTTSSDIFKDGELAEFEAYLIDGNNYFKLRDVCAAFDIGVTWDDDTNTIGLDTSLSYED